MKTLPESIQELFIEASLVAQDKELEDKSGIRGRVLEFFKSYIKEIDNVKVSTFLKNENILRCLNTGEDFEDWKNCSEEYNQLIEEAEIERQQKIRQENPYGII